MDLRIGTIAVVCSKFLGLFNLGIDYFFNPGRCVDKPNHDEHQQTFLHHELKAVTGLRSVWLRVKNLDYVQTKKGRKESQHNNCKNVDSPPPQLDCLLANKVRCSLKEEVANEYICKQTAYLFQVEHPEAELPWMDIEKVSEELG